MKKLIFIILCAAFVRAATAAANYTTHDIESTTLSTIGSENDEWRDITVYKLTKVGQYGTSSKAYSGRYNASTNELIVGKFTYTVYKNRAYGQEKDYRSEYQYIAGDYYFNL